MSKRLIIGIDSGTSVVKAVLVNLQGRELAISEENTPVETPKEGWSEFDLFEDWDSVIRAIRRLLIENHVDPEEIMAVSVTGKGWGCCYLDKNKKPVRKGILWNDARSASYIKEWAASGVLSEAFKITGNYYYTGDCGPITRWVIDNEPDIAKRVATILFPTNWIVLNLTGKIKLVRGDPCSLLDMRSLKYSDKIFELLGISSMREKFPTLSYSTEIAGELTLNAAKATGLKVGTPVILAESDVSSCATGVGVIEPGDVCIILGTAHIISICSKYPIFDNETGLLIPYVDGKFLKLVPPVIATPNQDWYLKNFGHMDYEEAKNANIGIYDYLEEKLRKIPPGADGIIYHPYLSPVGERCPFTKPSAKGNFFGLGLNHTRHHLLKAIFEGVAFSGYHCLLSSKIRLNNVMLSGGGARSEVWDETEADVLGKEVKLVVGKEFGAKGAIITAMVAMGLYKNYQSSIHDIVKIRKVLKPNIKRHELYSKIFHVYCNIISHLWNDWEDRLEILNEYSSLKN